MSACPLNIKNVVAVSQLNSFLCLRLCSFISFRVFGSTVIRPFSSKILAELVIIEDLLRLVLTDTCAHCFKPTIYFVCHSLNLKVCTEQRYSKLINVTSTAVASGKSDLSVRFDTKLNTERIGRHGKGLNKLFR